MFNSTYIKASTNRQLWGVTETKLIWIVKEMSLRSFWKTFVQKKKKQLCNKTQLLFIQGHSNIGSCLETAAGLWDLIRYPWRLTASLSCSNLPASASRSAQSQESCGPREQVQATGHQMGQGFASFPLKPEWMANSLLWWCCNQQCIDNAQTESCSED